jgi:hypothetical protein
MKNSDFWKVARYATGLAYLGVATSIITAVVGIDDAWAQKSRIAGKPNCADACRFDMSTLPRRGANVSEIAPYIRWHEGIVTLCGQTNEGQALIDCIGRMMGRLSGGVNFSDVPAKAPQIIAQTAEAATIRGKPKAEALVVLRRAASIIRGIATKSAADVSPAYNALSGVLGRAIAVIERGG